MSVLPNDASVAVPTGTITFVVTDIEGSTQRWDRDRFAMQEAVRRHDALMRAAISKHHGHVFKTIGDAFCAAFSKPEDAVAAMFDAQRALAAEDFSAVDGIRVRAAIHTGTADERDNDYFGPAVNRVARLLGLAYGGQVLVSGVTSDIVAGSLPPQASLRDLGEHRLKDLSRPEYVYQLLGPGLVAEFPPLKSLGTLPNNLPPQLKSFVGREAEIAEITALVSQHRIVTLVGSGGVGKTRTSLHVAANLLDGSGDGVWLIELAPLSSGEYIPSTIAQAMGVRLPSEDDSLAHLVSALKAKRALLLFDNCEHLVEATARVIAAIVRGCSEIHVLASSRQSLGIEGELAYRMPSLDGPSEFEASALTAEGAMRSPAIALFVERARASDPRFRLTDDNAPVVADICRHLDGIPLAIELAAARVKLLSPRQVRDRLDERFRILTGGSRDVMPRQQTLRALIDWSHDLLDERERLLFRRAAIFVSGFTFEGAVATCDGDLDDFEVMDVLASLVDKSLVLAEPNAEAVRYRLLESTRAYAAEKLAEARESEEIANRHLAYLRDGFAKLRAEVDRSRRFAGIARAFDAELDELRAALDHALTSSHLQTGSELLAAIEKQWEPSGRALEGIERVEKFIAALPAAESAFLGQLEGVACALLLNTGQHQLSLEAAERGVAHARASGDLPTLAWNLRWYSTAHMQLENFGASEEALREAETMAALSPRLRASLLELRGRLNAFTGDLEGAKRAFEQQRDEARALGNSSAAHVYASDVAEIEFRRGHIARAVEIWQEMLPAMRTDSDETFLPWVLGNLAVGLTATDDFAGAISAAHECISLLSSRDAGHFLVALAIETLALVLALGTDLHRAATLCGFADAALTRMSYKRQPGDQAGYDRLRAVLREKLPVGELARLIAGGAALSPEAAVKLALDVKPG
jgi:predicted ATPase/class 3 adenylate cyclase